MPEIILTIHLSTGLHARPAAMFVQTANKYKSIIRVRYGELEVNAKSIIGIMTVGASQGATLTVCAEGEDAAQALDSLRALVDSNFGEQP
jgi:phosphotransferase system HPr (HPr) family protein